MPAERDADQPGKQSERFGLDEERKDEAAAPRVRPMHRADAGNGGDRAGDAGKEADAVALEIVGAPRKRCRARQRIMAEGDAGGGRHRGAHRGFGLSLETGDEGGALAERAVDDPAAGEQGGERDQELGPRLHAPPILTPRATSRQPMSRRLKPVGKSIASTAA